jgi:hypothetical protein
MENTELTELIKKMGTEINQYPDNIYNKSPYYKKFLKLLHLYFIRSKIEEISVNKFSQITGVSKRNALQVLIDLNKILFNK